MLSVTERAVYGASMSSVEQLSLNPKIMGSLTLKAALPRTDNSWMHWVGRMHLDTSTGAQAVPVRSTSLGRGVWNIPESSDKTRGRGRPRPVLLSHFGFIHF